MSKKKCYRYILKYNDVPEAWINNMTEMIANTRNERDENVKGK